MASISQYYWGDIKELRLRVWGTDVPQQGLGQSPGIRGSGGRSPPAGSRGGAPVGVWSSFESEVFGSEAFL